MVRWGIVGYGYWGPNLVRNFSEVPGSQVVAVCDLRPDRLAALRARYPGVETTTAWRSLLDDERINAIAVATPVATHFELGRQALAAGKHLFMEKPFTATAGQAEELIAEADRRNLTLMVDHTFIYTGAVRKIRELIEGGELGDIYYYDSVRINLGLFQPDVNALWDLAVHDLAILNYLLPVRARAVSATGTSHVPGGVEDIGYVTLFYDSSLIAHIHVNWLAPVKVRRTLIGGSRRMVVYDDVEPSEKVKVYDKGISLNNGPERRYQVLVAYRTGDMWAPHLDMSEALGLEARHFVECVETGRRPLTGGESGLEVVRILEAACASIRKSGAAVAVTPGALPRSMAAVVS